METLGPSVRDLARATRADPSPTLGLMIALVVAAVAAGAAGVKLFELLKRASDQPPASVTAAAPASSRPVADRPAPGGVAVPPALVDAIAERVASMTVGGMPTANTVPLPPGTINADQAVDELRRNVAYDSDLCIPGRREMVVVAYRDYAQVRAIAVNRARSTGGEDGARAEAARWQPTDAWIRRRLSDLGNSGYFLVPPWMRARLESELPLLRELPQGEDRCPPPNAANDRPPHPNSQTFRRPPR